MSQEKEKKPSKLVYIEWDGYHHWEKYLVTYDQALSLIPIMINKVPSITLTDYDTSKIQGENSFNENRNNAIRDTSNESSISN
jgi:hypothetical protein